MGSDHSSLFGFYAWIGLVVSTSIFSVIRPSYNHLDRAFSELGEVGAPNYLVFNIITFGILGIMTLKFVEFVILFFENSKSRISFWFHRCAAISWILTGVFPLSPDVDWLSFMHLVFAVCSYVFAGLTILGYIRFFNQFTSGFTGFSLVSVWFLFGVWLIILYSSSIVSREIAQLVAILSFFTWQALFSILIFLKVNREGHPKISQH